MKKQHGFTLVELLVVIILLFVLGGWVANIVKLCQLDFEAPYKAEIIRVLGVPVAPVGAIVAWITFDEEE